MDKLIILIVCAFAVLSILIIGSASSDAGFFSRAVIVQMIAYAIGAAIIVIVLHIDYRKLLEKPKFLYIAAVAALLLVYVPGLGTEINNSRAWIDLGVTTLQPSEFAKILFILFLAKYLGDRKDDLFNFKQLLKSAIVAGPIILIVLKEDLGSALVFASIWLFMVFCAGISLKALFEFLAVFAALCPVAYYFMADYQKERIGSFLHQNNLSLIGNYQVWQSKVAIGSGGLFGKGLFNGTQKSLDFIPVQTSDFIFSVIGEELGFVGGLAVIVGFGFLIVRMTRIMQKSHDIYGSLIVAGVIGIMTFQTFENIAMTMGLMPVTGITLPFLSSGGSSIISNMCCVGLVLAVGAQERSRESVF
ncbi:MAG: rod shape-determining protein RodA [Eubacterium sp.]|jgi:rod shape determining protein RodA